MLYENKLSVESQNDKVQNTDCSSSIKAQKCISKEHDVVTSKKMNDTVNSEKCLNTPTSIKSKNLEKTSSGLLENSDLISAQFARDNTNVSGELKTEDDISSDNNADNIRLSVSSNENFGSRKWRSPGEKKFISASSTTNKRPIIATVSSTNGKEEILLKIYDIDVQIQRLMDEKMNLYKQLMAHSEECQENVTTKKSVARKLDLGTELKIDTAGSSRNAVSESVPTNENSITAVHQQSLTITNDLGESIESNSSLINNEHGKVNSEINSDSKQTNKRNKHSDSKSKNVNRNSDKENVSKRKTKKIQQENIDKSNTKIVTGNVENSEKVEIKKPQKIIEQNDKIESKKSPTLHVEKVEEVDVQKSLKSIGKDIESKKSPKKSRRERSSSSKKSTSKDKHGKETIRSDESEAKKSVFITEQNVTKRSIKASSVAPNSDAEDKSVKTHSSRIGNRDNEIHKIKNSKRKRDQKHEATYSDSNSDDEDKPIKNNFNRNVTPDSETRKIKSKRKQDHDNDSISSIKKHSNKKSRKKYVVSDSGDENESGIEQQRPSPPINNVETARIRRCSVEKRQKSVEHKLPTVKMNFVNSIIKPCIVPLVRINPEKYLKKIEVKEESETVLLNSTVSENEPQEIKITDTNFNENCVEQLNENSVNISNEPSPVTLSIPAQDNQGKTDDGTESQTSSTNVECSNNSINNNDVECGTQKLECFKCSDHTGSILFVKTYKNAIIAGGEDGKIYKYNVENGELLNSACAHQAAITSFYIANNKDGVTCVYSGSLDTYFKCFEIETLKELTSIQISIAIQCMDADWRYVFLGTVSGHLYRYSINNNLMEDEKCRIGNEAILALKTQSEGARRILIAAPRNELVSIRDAMTGLLLRYITFTTSDYTIYSIMLSQHGSIIYCGTNKKVILGYNFTDGVLTKELLAGKGIVCLLEYQKLLFAGCYDGFIYVFDIITNQLVTKFVGPGGMILALDVFDNKVIMGSKNSCLEVRSMPEVVLKYINENRR
ncbi:zinc finger protein 106 [Chrysoperla carnea]|uniref:zinc finger protein 106 n=1 Tax=Chrysoperla carnea TaxID=189513 RepID=UPI001D063B1A|nr:zinc finger protein 106 [Chrysoperla carnea]